MKTFTAAALALATLFAGGAAHAELKGSASFSSSMGSVSAPYEDAKSSTASVLFDLDKGYKLGVSVTALDAWGGSTNILGLRAVTPVSENVWFDTGLSYSDKGNISIFRRAGTTLNVKLPAQNLILGLGADYYDMRSGGAARTVTAQAVYYVPQTTWVLQGGASYIESQFNDRGGYRTSLAATYGPTGKWNVTGTYSTGRAHYELMNHPGSIADYHSTTTGVTGRYWLNKDTGVSVGASHVSNRYYKRTDLTVGVFTQF